MRKTLLAFAVLLSSILHADLVFTSQSCFNYDLHMSTWPGTSERVMVCFHGYGGNYKTALSLKHLECIEATLIGFNFPEHDIKKRKDYDYSKATFGTIDELLPALYVLKHVVMDQGIDSVDLYGFSAGGGALINVIGVLNTSTYDTKLKEIGIRALEKEKLLSAIQKGIIVLDTPLKSIEEIIEYRGSTLELECLAKNYRDNNLRPIDSLELLEGLSLDILLHFQAEDEVLSNRDDAVYIEKLRNVQPKTLVVVGDDGGHLSCHLTLWKLYSQKIAQLHL